MELKRKIELTAEQVLALGVVLDYMLDAEAMDYFSTHKTYDANSEHVYCSLRELAKIIYGAAWIKDYERKLDS